METLSIKKLDKKIKAWLELRKNLSPPGQFKVECCMLLSGYIKPAKKNPKTPFEEFKTVPLIALIETHQGKSIDSMEEFLKIREKINHYFLYPRKVESIVAVMKKINSLRSNVEMTLDKIDLFGTGPPSVFPQESITCTLM